MVYASFIELEKLFLTYPDNNYFKEIVKSNDADEKKKETLLDWHDIFYNLSPAWEFIKMKHSNDVLKIENFDSIKELCSKLESLEENNYVKAFITCENKTYPDMDLLEKYRDKIQLMYDLSTALSICSLDDFISMRSTLDYYKDLILEQQLSPLEQIAYVYDLIKSYTYSDNKDDKSAARSIHKIVKSGHIVCGGYSNLIAQILTELGIKCYTVEVTKKNNPEDKHVRLIIKVEDDKYGINEPFAFDATLDFARNVSLCQMKDGTLTYRSDDNPMQSGDVVLITYDNLCSYRYFMVPLVNYGKVFKNDYIDKVVNYVTKQNTMTDEQQEKLQNGFDSYPLQPVNKELFVKLLYKVRIAEGYSGDYLIEHINGLLKLNYISNKDETEFIYKIVEKIKEDIPKY